MVLKVVLDTNFLIYAVRYKIDIIGELKRVISSSFEVFIVDKTVEELEKLKKSSKTKLEASICLALVKDFKKLPAQGSVDATLVSLAAKDTIIATNDAALKRQISTPLLVIRQKSHVELINQNLY